MAENQSSDESDKLALLIEVIQHYEFLYDMTNKNYKNTKQKEHAWQEISAIVNMSVEDCQRQWKNLRDRFTKEKRAPASGSGATSPNWPFFEKMLFYTKFTKSRKTHTTTPTVFKRTESTPSSSCSPQPQSPWSTLDIIMSPSPVLSERDDNDGTSPVPSPSLSETPTSSKKGTTTAAGKTRKNEDVTEIMKVAENIATSLNKAKVAKTDANKSFADYLYARLCEMTSEESRRKRKALLLLLEED